MLVFLVLGGLGLLLLVGGIVRGDVHAGLLDSLDAGGTGLTPEVRKPADAARYRVEQEAEGAKNAAIKKFEADRLSTVAAAQATAEQQRLVGEGDRARRTAIAEAEALDARARAFTGFGEAAVLDLLVKVLPDVVREASAPLAAVDRMTVISTDGAASLTRSVAAHVEQGLR